MKIFTQQLKKNKKGFTLTELLVVIAVMALIGSIVWGGLSNYRDVQALQSTTDVIVATLGEARSRAISSVEAIQYGVHFEEKSIVMFEGSQYSASSASNTTTVLSNAISVSSSGLTSSSTEIVFEKITGKGSASGQITVSLSANEDKNFVIIVEPIGIAYRK
ncbi:MAG: prepilin-type N-terminal cleavage/methylation domain-containing protein [Candidatus Paceibacterota bacterium]|jgi:prepilin-type N-terminal cleavage/methylation domain-containing protein